LFNPARNRTSTIRRALEITLRFIGFNRRMHNKAWIADNRVAIVGGRNIGDRYFGASREVNYRDSDLLVLGPAVGEASAIFDEFWNSREVVPLQALQNNGSHWSQEEFAAKRQQWLATAKATSWGRALAKREDLQERLQQGDLPLHWSSSIHVLSDPPEKAAPLSSRRERAGWLLYDIMALLYSARQESWLMTPYFVPGKGGTVLLAGQVRRGMKVRVLTNSLATNVVPLVYASYSKYRKLLLGQGVSLYELNPDPGDFGSDHGVSLHSKAFVVDNERGFVGSFNFDPRSEQLNTEMGVVFDDMELAQELTQFFEKSIQLENAWHVTLTSGGDLRWHGEDGRAWEHEPETSAGLRWLVWLMAFLPIESEL
jgi:putative cardiolipin synthase